MKAKSLKIIVYSCSFLASETRLKLKKCKELVLHEVNPLSKCNKALPEKSEITIFNEIRFHKKLV